jgi:hypothetical protein
LVPCIVGSDRCQCFAFSSAADVTLAATNKWRKRLHYVLATIKEGGIWNDMKHHGYFCNRHGRRDEAALGGSH